MARAKISDIRHIERLAWHSVKGFQPLALQAETEARAILAETEGRPYEVERPVMIGFDVYLFETQIMAGLAEALGSFVEA